MHYVLGVLCLARAGAGGHCLYAGESRACPAATQRLGTRVWVRVMLLVLSVTALWEPPQNHCEHPGHEGGPRRSPLRSAPRNGRHRSAPEPNLGLPSRAGQSATRPPRRLGGGQRGALLARVTGRRAGHRRPRLTPGYAEASSSLSTSSAHSHRGRLRVRRRPPAAPPLQRRAGAPRHSPRSPAPPLPLHSSRAQPPPRHATHPRRDAGHGAYAPQPRAARPLNGATGAPPPASSSSPPLPPPGHPQAPPRGQATGSRRAFPPGIPASLVDAAATRPRAPAHHGHAGRGAHSHPYGARAGAQAGVPSEGPCLAPRRRLRVCWAPSRQSGSPGAPSPGVREPSARGSRKSWTGLGPQLWAVKASNQPVATLRSCKLGLSYWQ
jgi:hypothetical protein